MSKRRTPFFCLCVSLAFYYANKPEDRSWVVMPVTNFDAYWQTTSFSRKWLPTLDGLLVERSAQS